MFNFDQTINLPLEAIEDLYELTNGSALDPLVLAEAKQEIKLLADFFQCDEEQAVILSLLVLKEMRDGFSSISCIVDHAGLKISQSIYLNKILSLFVDRGWIQPKHNPDLYPLTKYSISDSLIHYVSSGVWQTLEDKKESSPFDILERLQKAHDQRENSPDAYQNFCRNIHPFIAQYSTNPVCIFLANSGLSQEESIQFLFICLQHYTGTEIVHFEALADSVDASMHTRYLLRQSLQNGEHPLMKMGLIKETCSPNFYTPDGFSLTEKGIRTYDPSAVIKLNNHLEMMQSISPVSIVPTKMFYEPDVSDTMRQLHQIIQRDQFRNISDSLRNKGMKGGISVLMYGHPGTGKTESVLQLAKSSGRHVLSVDASKIRSKWQGQSAKNIKSLFKDYRELLQQYEDAPILLFNEADSVLGKRYEIKDRGDQEMNTVQNILLEEMEHFEGIFIATTNQEKNLDKAFDRRFLYKIRFDKPGKEVLLQIWKTKFPKVRRNVLEKLCQQVTLSGGQVENVRKKVVIDTILHPGRKVNEHYLLQLALQERQLENNASQRPPLGFLKSA